MRTIRRRERKALSRMAPSDGRTGKDPRTLSLSPSRVNGCDGRLRSGSVNSTNPMSAEGTPDAPGTQMKRNDLRSVLASPGEDTQHHDFEREEHEDLTNVHRTGLYSFGAAARPSHRSPRGRSRAGGGWRVRASRTPRGTPPLLLGRCKTRSTSRLGWRREVSA